MNSWSWIAWLAAALVFISSTRNPLYLVLILLALNIVFAIYNDGADGESLAVVSPFRFSLFVITVSVLFNLITSHFGETILFSIPGNIPLISGPVTLEALIFGFTNGLVLSCMLTAFTIINLVLPVSSLIRLVPRAFYPLSIIVSIAVTFIPSTRRQVDQVIEAQKIRGHRLSGLRDWLPLMMPLLIGGLERSMLLAETMTARGFASHAGQMGLLDRSLVLAGLLLVLTGWILSLSETFQALGIVLVCGGASLIGFAFWKLGRQMPRTSYKREAWRLRDFVLTAASIGLIYSLLFGLSDQQKATLSYQPYPIASFPPFDSLNGLMILVLLIPAVLKPKSSR
jgi:energy-coupling factor transport system permease protein